MAGFTLILKLLLEGGDECLAAEGFWNWRLGLFLDNNSVFRFQFWVISCRPLLWSVSSVCLLHHFWQVNHFCVIELVDHLKDFFAVCIRNWACSNRRCLGSSWFGMVDLFLKVLRVVLCATLFAQSLQVFLGETTLVRGNLFVDVFIETVFMFVYTFVD